MDDSARKFLFHLGKASGLIRDRALAEEKLSLTLKQLRAISTKAVQKELDRLEVRMRDVLALERRLSVSQVRGEQSHVRLRHKLESVEARLAEYVHIHKVRETRLHDIESKIMGKLKHDDLRTRLISLEKRYLEFKTSGKHNDQLLALKHRIDAVKRILKGP